MSSYPVLYSFRRCPYAMRARMAVMQSGNVGELREVVLRDKLADTRDQIARLQALERELVSSLDYLEACPSCDPARILEACSRCELHASDQEAPDLVAGFHAQ